jgi:hypothetical protein
MRVLSTVALVVVVVATAAYSGSYFLAVRPGVRDCQGGVWVAIEEYPKSGLLAARHQRAFYRAANWLDRRLLRPSVWSGTYDFLSAIRNGIPGPQPVPIAAPPNKHLQATPL